MIELESVGMIMNNLEEVIFWILEVLTKINSPL